MTESGAGRSEAHSGTASQRIQAKVQQRIAGNRILEIENRRQLQRPVPAVGENVGAVKQVDHRFRVTSKENPGHLAR